MSKNKCTKIKQIKSLMCSFKKRTKFQYVPSHEKGAMFALCSRKFNEIIGTISFEGVYTRTAFIYTDLMTCLSQTFAILDCRLKLVFKTRQLSTF